MEAKSIVTQPSNSLPPSQRGIETLPTLNTIFPIVISLTILSLICIPIYICIAKGLQYSFILKPGDRVVCHRCRYFNNNHFLKCALHPVTVLTEQSIDCSDYCPNRQAKRAEKLRRVLLSIRKVISR
jgi:hypothetical protein